MIKRLIFLSLGVYAATKLEKNFKLRNEAKKTDAVPAETKFREKVDTMSEDSFPASDPPSFSPPSSIYGPH